MKTTNANTAAPAFEVEHLGGALWTVQDNDGVESLFDNKSHAEAYALKLCAAAAA